MLTQDVNSSVFVNRYNKCYAAHIIHVIARQLIFRTMTWLSLAHELMNT